MVQGKQKGLRSSQFLGVQGRTPGQDSVSSEEEVKMAMDWSCRESRALGRASKCRKLCLKLSDREEQHERSQQNTKTMRKQGKWC